MAAFYVLYWTNGHWGQWLDLPSAGPLYESATAMALACVVTTQIGNLFAQRASRQSIFKVPLFNNKLIWVGVASELLVLLGIVYVPFLQKFIGTGPFDPKYFLLHLLWIPLLPIADAIRKAFVRSKEQHQAKTVIIEGETR